jgi:hypothetical protein
VVSRNRAIDLAQREDAMLGKQISGEIGQVTGTRVLPSQNGALTVESSFEAHGTLLSEQVNDIGTYVSVLQPDGTLKGEGQGITMTESGATIAWVGHGVGRFTGRGNAVSWRGTLLYSTTSEKFASLNATAGIFEFELDETGKSEAKVWAWE